MELVESQHFETLSRFGFLQFARKSLLINNPFALVLQTLKENRTVQYTCTYYTCNVCVFFIHQNYYFIHQNATKEK